MDVLDSIRVLGRERCDDTRPVASICTECFEVRLEKTIRRGVVANEYVWGINLLGCLRHHYSLNQRW